MKLIDNWQQVAKESWSIHATATAFFLLGFSELLYHIFDRVIVHPIILGWSIIGILAWGCVGRLIKQHMDKSVARWRRYRFSIAAIIGVLVINAANSAFAMGDFPEPRKTEVSAEISGVPYSDEAFYDVAVDLIAKWEGKRNAAYQDVIGVWTICYGHTHGVRPGDYMTDEECRALLRKDIRSYRLGLHRYFTDETQARRLTPDRDAAFTSLAINIGYAGAGKSTATRRLNAGNVPGACVAATWYNKAGGRVWVGLERRRADEYRHCMKGLAA